MVSAIRAGVRVLLLVWVIGLGVSLAQNFQLWLAIVYVCALLGGLIASQMARGRWGAGLLAGGTSLLLFFGLFVGLVIVSVLAKGHSVDGRDWTLVAYVLVTTPLTFVCFFAGLVAGWLAMDLRRHLESA